jgi:DNA-binding transcriptional LysR family regulator
MTTDQMKNFLEAAKELNFTAAAERLYMTQPALSQQIAAMEKELNTQLFVRRNNSLRLTLSGETLYNGIGDLYQRYLALVEAVIDASSGSSGQFSIGLLEDQLLDDVLVSSISELVKNNPNVQICVNRHDYSSLYSGLIDGSLDLAVTLVYDEVAMNGMQIMPIYTSPVYLAVSKKHPAAQLNQINFKDIAGISETIPLLLTSPENFPPPLRTFLDHHAEAFQPSFGFKRCHVPSVSALSLYVTAGLGVAIVNRDHMLSLDPNVTLIPIESSEVQVKGMIWKDTNINPILRFMVKTIKNKLQLNELS